jgi:hypothetical protein
MDDRLAELRHLFAGTGWVFGTVARSEPPPGVNLTAQRGAVLLAAPGVAALAEKIRREEAR